MLTSSDHTVRKYWFWGREAESMWAPERKLNTVSYWLHLCIITRKTKKYCFWVGEKVFCQPKENKFLRFPWRSAGGRLKYRSYQKMYLKIVINTFTPRWEIFEAQRAKKTNICWSRNKWNSSNICSYYHYLYFMYAVQQLGEVLSSPFTNMEHESQVVQLAKVTHLICGQARIHTQLYVSPKSMGFLLHPVDLM